MTGHAKEVSTGERFEFGANWTRFLSVLDDERIAQAKKSLGQMLGVETLEGKSFIDVGSGSGLFSLAAKMLGARVRSFDYDPKSVACTNELKRQYFPDDEHWLVEEGSILNQAYLNELGRFDIVYCWGVLHHTGQMWQAISNVASLVEKGGTLFIAIYNDQGRASLWWKAVKKIYCSGLVGRALMKSIYYPYFGIGRAVLDISGLRNPLARYREYKKLRGMSAWCDVTDWIGGYPFEVAKPEEIFNYFYIRNFELVRMKTCGGGLGCNEFVFQKKMA